MQDCDGSSNSCPRLERGSCWLVSDDTKAVKLSERHHSPSALNSTVRTAQALKRWWVRKGLGIEGGLFLVVALTTTTTTGTTTTIVTIARFSASRPRNCCLPSFLPLPNALYQPSKHASNLIESLVDRYCRSGGYGFLLPSVLRIVTRCSSCGCRSPTAGGRVY